MKPRPKWIVLALVILAVGAGAATLGYAAYRRAFPAAAALGGEGRVTRGHLDVIVRTQGLIVPATTIEVKSRASGLVQAVHATAGDRVRKDQILLEVDPTRSRLAEEEARSEVENARSQVRLAEEALDPERVALARKRHERQRELSDQGLIRRDELETAEYDLAAAERTLRSQQKQLEASKLRLETALTRLRRAQTELTFTVIRSPMDGVVMTRNVEVGSGVTSFSDSVQGGTVLFKIGSLDRLAFDGALSVSDLTKVRPGLTARVTSDAWREPATGTVSYVGQEAISPAASATTANRAPTFQVKIQLERTPGSDVPLNVPASAEIVVSTVSNALLAPFSCVRHLPNSEGMLREVAGGEVRERRVKLGPVGSGTIQVLGDIAEGTQLTGCGGGAPPIVVRP